MKYRIVHPVEIEGTMYYPATGKRPADVVDESIFRPGDPKRHPNEYMKHEETRDLPPELGEIESLLQTGHIEPVS